LPFLTLIVIVSGFVWAVASIYFSGQIATARGQAELAEKQRDDFKSKLSVSNPEEARTKLDRLEGELAGLHKIFSATIGYEWKPLTDRQVADLAGRLAVMEKHIVSIMYVNQLGKELAQTFHHAFLEAGWEQVQLSDGGGAHHGIIAGSGSERAGRLKQAIESSTPYKIDLNRPADSDGPFVYLIIGINPVAHDDWKPSDQKLNR